MWPNVRPQQLKILVNAAISLDDLVFCFLAEYLPPDERDIRSYLRRRGAYFMFKRRLSERGLLETWFTYETAAKADALRSWASAHGLALRVARSSTLSSL